jgi:hypothetical protein
MRGYFRLLRALLQIRSKHAAWFNASDRSHGEPESWPRGFGPRKSAVYAHNRLKIEQPAEELFAKLGLAEQWPDWYGNSADVEIRRARTGRFARNARRLRRVGERVGGPAASREEPETDQTVRTPAMFAERPARQLGPGVEFRWTTFGIRVRSRVTQFEPNERIAWNARALGLRVFHRWYFKADGSGTLVITEECERGPLPWLIRRWMNPALHAGHRLWLESLKQATHVVDTPSDPGS